MRYFIVYYIVEGYMGRAAMWQLESSTYPNASKVKEDIEEVEQRTIHVTNVQELTEEDYKNWIA